MDLLQLQVENVLAFDRVSHLLNGMAAVSWLPGIASTFDKKHRFPADRTRPVCLVLEAADSNLTLSAAIAWPRGGKMHFNIYGRWDFRAPISVHGRHAQLNLNKAKHRLNASRGVDMLQAMLNYGFDSLRGAVPDLAEPRWPSACVVFPHGREVIDARKLDLLAAQQAPTALAGMYKDQLRHELVDFSGELVSVDVKVVSDAEIARAIRQNRLVEDFSPVLGVRERNPAKAIKTVDIRLTNNPANKILARHGIEDVESVSADVLDQLAVEFTAEVNASFQQPVNLPESVIYDALLEPQKPVPVTLSREQALSEGHGHVVANAMRQISNKRIGKEATESELIAAARDITQPLVLNRLSTVQLNTVSAWQELPPQYSGSILAPVDWVPRSAFNYATRPEPVEA